MDSGRAEVGDEILRLFGLARDDFDGRVETCSASPCRRTCPP
ncbi:hypothetical protein SGLAM104S_06324 [Streptomyces glaucescens]